MFQLFRSRAWITALLVFVAVFITQSLFVKIYGVDVPFWDEWYGTFLVLQRYNTGQFSWLDLFNQHLDHRIFISKIIFIELFNIFREGNLISYMLFSALLSAGIAAIAAFSLAKMKYDLWIIIAVSAILVSPMQSDNMLWGFQVAFYTLVLGVILAISIISLSSVIYWRHIVLLIFCCVFSMLSIVSGILSWVVVGACLLLWKWMRVVSIKDVLKDYAFQIKLLVFVVVGICSVGLYFRNYAYFAVGRSSDIWLMITWSLTAMSYPAIIPVDSINTVWVLIFFVFFWAPILINITVLLVRMKIDKNKNKAAFIIGICLFLVVNIGIISYGRSHGVFIPSRYATIFLWSGVISIMSLADLIRYACMLRNGYRIPLVALCSTLCASLIFVQCWRYGTGLELMQQHHAEHSVYRDTVMAYVNDPSQQRVLREPAPLPRDPLIALLNDHDFLDILPFSLRPSFESIYGNAWKMGGAFVTVENRGSAWGSWNGSDANTGVFTSKDMQIDTSNFSLLITGYPSASGNSLRIESVANPKEQVIYTGADPGDQWSTWKVDMSHFTDKRIHIVGVDNAKTVKGWFGFDLESSENTFDRTMGLFLAHFVMIILGICVLYVGIYASLKYRLSIIGFSRRILPAKIYDSQDQLSVNDIQSSIVHRPDTFTNGDTITLVILIFILSFLAQALIIKIYGVNAPYWDEWGDFPRFLAAYRSGTLTWHDFFAQHNEHRILTSRIAFLLTFAFIGEWNPQANMLFSALLVSSLASIWAYAVKHSSLPTWVAWISAVILISPAQYQNMTWGFQFVFYSVVFFVICSICCVALARNIHWRLIMLVSVTCFFATFSVASGIMAWPVVGLCLALKAYLRMKSLRLMLIDKQIWMKFIVFGGVALATVVFYFHDYIAPVGDEFRVKTIYQFVSWLTMSLSYPFYMSASTPFVLLLSAVLLLWIPILFYIRQLLRKRADERVQDTLVFLAGITIFMVLNAAAIGYGRGGIDIPLASRYTTIFSWNSLLSLAAIGGLLQQIGMRPASRRLQIGVVTLCLLIFGLVVLHERRALDGYADLRQNTADRVRMNQTVISYLNNHASEQLRNEPIPFPWADLLQQRLDDPSEVATLPQELLNTGDPQGWILAGNAWSIGGVVPTTPSPGQVIGLGSWSGSDAYTGSIISRPIHIQARYLLVPLVGYLGSGFNNSIRIEPVNAPDQAILFSSETKGTNWYYWKVDVSQLYGQDVRLVAIDNSTGTNGWFGFGWPSQLSWSQVLLRRFWNVLEYLLGAALVLPWIWTLLRGYFINRQTHS